MTFIYFYIVLSPVLVNLLSAVPEFNVSEPVGSTAVLPCQLTSGDTDTPHIRWQIKVKTDYKTVFERLGEESYQGEGYKGRVDVPVEELRKGNCSLVLRDLRLNDTGVYTSYLAMTRPKRDLPDTKNISRVKLSVYDKAEERTDENPDVSDNGGNNHQYWWILVLPAVVLPGLGVWYLKKRKNTNNVL